VIAGKATRVGNEYVVAIGRECPGLDRGGGRPRGGGLLRAARTTRQTAKAGSGATARTGCASRAGRARPGDSGSPELAEAPVGLAEREAGAYLTVNGDVEPCKSSGAGTTTE
jgi:hypothetical protein